jgi:hypothetical protein
MWKERSQLQATQPLVCPASTEEATDMVRSQDGLFSPSPFSPMDTTQDRDELLSSPASVQAAGMGVSINGCGFKPLNFGVIVMQK